MPHLILAGNVLRTVGGKFKVYDPEYTLHILWICPAVSPSPISSWLVSLGITFTEVCLYHPSFVLPIQTCPSILTNSPTVRAHSSIDWAPDAAPETDKYHTHFPTKATSVALCCLGSNVGWLVKVCEPPVSFLSCPDL
jgi:hypothetical protein